MSNELKNYDNNQMNTDQDSVLTENTEPIPSMDDFKDLIDKSFRKISEGDIIKGIVIGKSDTEVTVDLGYYTEGIIRLEELSNDPTFSIKEDIAVGEEISAIVLSTDDGNGNILLSKKRADEILAWDKIYEDFEKRNIVRVKIVQAVNGGVIAYLYGVRAFIPASQLTLSFVENLETWVGKEIDAVIVTASKENRKLVLSGKEVEIQKAETEKANKISKLARGTVTTGTVEKIMPYGAFVSIGEGLSGLLHISQISEKRIKSPNEVIKTGDKVTVKIIDIKDGKISLSMKDVEDKDEVVEDVEEAPVSYSTGGEATTNLASLLKNIKL
ncbi:MAG TPA: S1 RNA-binding domain-containing protein [Mobilitalea sp.]|nr:S1 RNA-binding domain-containing protein [Mobilitalea sp.]